MDADLDSRDHGDLNYETTRLEHQPLPAKQLTCTFTAPSSAAPASSPRTNKIQANHSFDDHKNYCFFLYRGNATNLSHSIHRIIIRIKGYEMATQLANRVRSSSSPSLPHPLAIKVAEKLHKLKNCIHAESSFPAVCGALENLADLFDSLQHLLSLPSLERLLHKRWVEEQLDGSLRLLDMDAAMSDCLAAAKALVVDLWSALRKKGVDSHVSSRKKAQKEAANCKRSLKKMEDGLAIGAGAGAGAEGDLIVLDRLMREAREMAAAVLRSLLNLIAIPVAQKHGSRRLSLVPKALQLRRGGAAVVNGGGSGAVGLEALLSAAFDCVSGKDDGFGMLEKTADDQLSVVEAGIEGLEIGLQCLFRRLIQNRVALLNVLSF